MNKLQNVLSFLKKYHFWVICGIVLITTVTCSWWATAGMADKFQKRKSKIEGEFSALVIPGDHPNRGMIEEVRKKDAELKQSVYRAWEIMYGEQKEKNSFPADLGEDLKQAFESLGPKKELDREYRDRYQNYINDHFPSLLTLVDVIRPDETGVEAGGGTARRRGVGGVTSGTLRRPTMGDGGDGRLGSETKWIGVVDWSDGDYGKLVKRFDWMATPSTMDIVLAQEDLWVYEAMLRVIRNTNEKATTPANAIVGRIDNLEIGQLASDALSKFEEVVFRAPKTIEQTNAENARQNRVLRSTGNAQEMQLQMLMEGRYIDDKGKPLSYVKEYPYANHPFKQFKMMPIHMSLMMDQRSLPKLLVACANSNMPIEVRRVGMRATAGEVIDLKAPVAADGTGGEGGEGGRPGRTGGGRGMRRAASSAGLMGGGEGAMAQNPRPYDVPVEIFGVIYIYNSPAPETVGLDAALAEKPAAGAAVPAAPAGGSATQPAVPPSPAPTGSTP